jgi:predicted ATP-grasp superfamily ATP-dependent carboligase
MMVTRRTAPTLRWRSRVGRMRIWSENCRNFVVWSEDTKHDAAAFEDVVSNIADESRHNGCETVCASSALGDWTGVKIC